MTKDDLIGKTFVADVTQYTPEINGEPLYKHSDEQHPQVNLYLIFEKTKILYSSLRICIKLLFL